MLVSHVGIDRVMDTSDDRLEMFMKGLPRSDFAKRLDQIASESRTADDDLATLGWKLDVELARELFANDLKFTAGIKFRWRMMWAGAKWWCSKVGMLLYLYYLAKAVFACVYVSLLSTAFWAIGTVVAV